VPPFGDLGVTYTIYLWLVGKRVADFLLVLIELFSPSLTLRRYERILVEIVVFERGWVTLSANFRGRGHPPRTFGIRKRVSELSRGVVCVIRLAVFSERTTLRSLYAISRPSVVCLSVCCL